MTLSPTRSQAFVACLSREPRSYGVYDTVSDVCDTDALLRDMRFAYGCCYGDAERGQPGAWLRARVPFGSVGRFRLQIKGLLLKALLLSRVLRDC